MTYQPLQASKEVELEAVSESFGPVKGPKLSLIGFVMALPPVLLILSFIGLPIITAFFFSIGFTGGLNRVVSLIGQRIHKTASWHGTLAAYQDVIHDARFAGDLFATLFVSILSTAIVLLLALGIGLYTRIRGGRLATIMSALSLTPLFVPVVISAWAIHTFYSGSGFVKTFFEQFGIKTTTITSTLSAMVIGSVWTSLPFAILMVTSGLQSVPDALIETAQDAGAGFMRIVRTILIPLASTPIMIAGTFTAIGIMGSFTIPYFLGPNQPTMLGVEINNFFNAYNRPQQSIVMAFIVFAAASGIAIFYVTSNVKSAKASGRI